MCYNIAFLQKRLEKYAERYKEVLPPRWQNNGLQNDLPTYYFVSGFSHPTLPVVHHKGIYFSEWGLIPYWVKNQTKASEIRNKTLNAAGETLYEKPSYKRAAAEGRCLLGVSGFFEWREFSGEKYPYYIKSNLWQTMSLGCVYDLWNNPVTNETICTFSIITTPANPLMEKIHNRKKRMPLIIRPEDEGKWISPSTSKKEIENLIQPYMHNDLWAHPIPKTANNVKQNRNIPEITDIEKYPNLPDI